MCFSAIVTGGGGFNHEERSLISVGMTEVRKVLVSLGRWA
jgi:hypothetical protein